ncbi:MAG: MarR family transcriptional regulator [Firmicutes bacterium]|nr:MarR family transcriptional regulator [Bacillota bacterium]
MVAEKKVNRFLEAMEGIRKFFVSMENFAGEADLGKLELMALFFISKEKELIMSRLAKGLGISLSMATVIIDQLLKKKLLTRERSTKDRRIVKVKLTEKGEKTASVCQKKKKEIIKRILTMLTENEQENFILILEKIAREGIEFEKGNKGVRI